MPGIATKRRQYQAPAQEQCPVVYEGASYPQLRGTRCTRNQHPHAGLRHEARPGGKYLGWWTAEEKASIRESR